MTKVEKSKDNVIRNLFKEDTRAEMKSRALSTVKLSLAPFRLLIDNFKSISVVFSVFALIISFLSFALGTSYSCTIDNGSSFLFYCIDEYYIYIAYFILKLLIITGFFISCYNIFKGDKVSISSMLSFSKKNLVIFLIFIASVLIMMVPLLSVYILYEREPNPDWQVELMFFFVVSLGFFTPFVVMRLLSFLGFYLQEGKFISLLTVWSRGSGQGFKMVFALSIVAFLSLLLFTSFFTNVSKQGIQDLFIAKFLIEYVYNIITLLMLNLLLGHIFEQTKQLFEDKASEEE